MPRPRRKATTEETEVNPTETNELEPTAGTSLAAEDLPAAEHTYAEDTDGAFASQAEDLDVETPAEPDSDDDVEDIPVGPNDETAGTDKPKKATKEKAQPKRGELPDGYVTPIGLTKAINEQGLYRNREGEVAELKPQMVYSYIKNAPKDRPYPGETVTDSVGTQRENCVKLEDGLAWWNAKNEAAEQRRQNAAEKAEKAAAAKAKKAAATTEAEGDDEPAVTEEAE